MTDAYSELDIEVEGTAEAGQKVRLTFRKADEALSTAREVGPFEISINFTELLQHELDHESYGNRLQSYIFAPTAVRDLFTEAMAAKPLRIRLRLRTDDQKMHAVRWELMTGHEGAALSTRSELAFSRFHASGRQVELRASAKKLRALVAVVNPTEEERAHFKLAEIETDIERRAKGLGSIQYDSLTEEQGQGQVTMNRLMAKLRAGEEVDGGYDILYLVCHGTVSKAGKPLLLFGLETQAELAHKTRFRSGEQLAKRMVDELKELPRLIVLASCAGAGTGSGNALSATGPLLARTGIPAVMAMQGYVAINTVDALLPEFFKEFQKTGAVDQAMQSARNYVLNYQAADDWWAPVLFMRLSDGRLEYQEPGVSTQGIDEHDTVTETDEIPSTVEREPSGGAGDTVQYMAPDPLDMTKFDRVTLYNAMLANFNASDLGDLAFATNIEYDDLAGSTRSAKVREFITYCQRRGMLPALLVNLSQARPHVDWYAEAGLR